MSEEVRETLGERLVKRLTRRERRRPRIGFTPEFYARLGADDPWATPDAHGDEGRVFLSSAPYYAMMRRLAAAARRRERRLERFSERRTGHTLRAATRPAPGEAPLAQSRLARLAIDALTLPPPIERAAEAPAEAEAPAVRRRASPRLPSRTRGAQTASTRIVVERVEVPVEVAAAATTTPTERPAARPRPFERVAMRAQQASVTSSAPLRAVESAMAQLPAGRQPAARAALAALAELPAAEQAPAAARVLRALRVPTDALESAEAARPVRRAADRAAPSGASSHRSLLSGSPAMALAASADTDRAAAGTLAEAERRAPDSAAARPRRVAATARAAARAIADAPGRSTVPAPVASARVSQVRPVATPPVVRTEAARGPHGRASAPLHAPTRPSAVAMTRLLGTPRSSLPDSVPSSDAMDVVARAAARAQAPAPGSRAGRSLVPPPVAHIAPEPRVVDASPEAAPAPEARDGRWRAPSRRSSRSARVASATAPIATVPAAPSPVARAAGRAAASVTHAITRRFATVLAPTVFASPASVDRSADAPAAPSGAAPSPATPTSASTSRAPARAGREPAMGAIAPAVRWAAARAEAAEADTRSPAPAASFLPTPVGPAALSTRPSAARVVRALLSPSFAAAPAAVPASGQARIAARSPAAGAPAPAATRSRSTLDGRALTLPPVATASEAPTAPAAVTRPAARTTAVATRPTGTSTEAAARRAGVPSVGSPTARRALDALIAGLGDSAAPPVRFARTGPLAFVGVRGVPESLSADAAVRTTDGAYVTARQAAARGLVVTSDPAGRLVEARRPPVAERRATAPQTRALRDAASSMVPIRPLAAQAETALPMGARGPSVNPSEAPDAPGTSLAAAPRRLRAAEHALERSRVEQATAYRGAFAAPVVVSARASDTAPAPKRGATRRAATAAPGVLPEPARDTTDRASSPVSGSSSPTSDAGARRLRASLEQRLGRVSEGRTDGATGWIDRAEGSPRIASVSGMLGALARATTAEEIVRVIAARAEPGLAASDAARLPLDPAAAQVIAQVRDEARREVAETVSLAAPEPRRSRLAAPEASNLRPSGPAWSEPQLGRSRPRRAATAVSRAHTATGGDDKLSKLVRRLQDLIHLAEDQNRLAAARSEVRMAEDSAQARAEAQGGHGGGPEPVGNQKQDIEALGREVLEAVAKELELRRSRRMEDSDESVWW